MPDVNVLTVLVAAVVLFLLGWAYNGLVGQPDEAEAEFAPWKLGVEGLRCLTLAAVVAGLASQGEIDEWSGGLALGLALWIGFPVVLWVGAMIWANTAPKLAALHAGDWLAKLLVLGVIVSVWQ